MIEPPSARVEWVPSDRERESGVTEHGAPALPAAELPPRVPLRRRFTAGLRGLNPRTIGGGSAGSIVIVALLASVAQWDDNLFSLLLPFIKIDMGFDFTFMATLMSTVAVVTTVLAPITGYLADRVSRVSIVRAGALIGNAAAVVTGVAPNPAMLVGARVVGGLGQGIEEPVRLPLLTDLAAPEHRVRAFSLLQVAATVGPALALLGLYVAMFRIGVSWRAVMIGSGILSLGVTALTLRLREPVRGRLDRIASGATDDDAAREQRPVGWGEGWRTLRGIASLRRLWYATPFLALSQTAMWSFLFFALFRRLTLGDVRGPGAGLLQSTNGFFVLIALPPLLGIVALAFATPVAERLMRRSPGKIMVLAGSALALQAVGIVGLVVLPWLPLAYLMMFIVQALGTMIIPAQNTLLAAVVPPRVRAQGIASVAWWRLLGLMLLPIAGRLADTYGILPAIMILACVLGVGAIVTATGGAHVAHDLKAALAASRADEEAQAARRAGAAKMIVCRDVEVHHDGTQVLFGVDFDVAEGEMIALLGTNGAGKSTLLRAICGLHAASGGAVFLDGEDVTHKPASLNARDGVVFLPGGRAIFPTLTVEENLRAAAWLDRADPATTAQRTERVLDTFPILRERLAQQAGNLSGGEQQMVALGQSLIMKPRLLLIDELSLGLAPAVVETLLGLVREIHAQGTTIVLVEQSVNVALTIAGRAVYMDKGRIVFDGPTADLLARRDLVRSVFLGSGSQRYAITGRPAPSAASDRVLDVDGVEVSFGGIHALRGVSLHADAGEIVGIVGPNGAGKTTLFDVIGGVIAPDAGLVRLGGQDVTGLRPDERARAGLTRSFQAARLFPSLTVRENLAIALERHLGARSAAAAAVWAAPVRAAERRIARRVEHVIGSLALDAYADKFANELSTGTRRLVDVAAVMLAEPKVLLLDEPSSGLAQAEIEVLGPVLQRLARESGCAIVVIEHDIPLVTAISDRLVAMETGAVIAAGPPAEVIADEAVIGSYLSASRAVIDRSGDAVTAALDALGLAPATPASREE